MSSEENKLNVQGYNIVTILKRLETATSRLEDITMLQEDVYNSKKLESNDTSTKALAAAPASQVEEPTEEKSKAIVQFEQFIEEHVKPLVDISSKIDSVVHEQATKFYEAFQEQAKFLYIASQVKKPELADAKLMDLIKPINTKIELIGSIKDSNRSSKYFNHLNTIAEGAPVLGWILNDTPVSLIPEFKDSAQFWSNRIVKEYKDTDKTHVEWVKVFLSIFDPLKDYVKEFHTKGTKWNPNGKSLDSYLSSTNSGAAPPPPPPPPPADLYAETSKPASGGINAVFADLNKGEGITSGLRKVEKSQMTHKNPELRNTPAAPKKPVLPKKPTSLSSSAPAKKPAKKELLDGSKWIIENFTKADLKGEDLITIDAEMHQSIFIGNCSNITIQIKGKANAISLANTSSCGFVIDSLISGIDLIKCHKFGLQVLGTVADISIDQCDEGSIYLSKQSIEANTQIYSSSTTALNVNVPKDDDYVELPAPEQFRHFVKNGKLVSEVVEHVA